MKKQNFAFLMALVGCLQFSSCAKKEEKSNRGDSVRNSDRVIDEQRTVVEQIEEIQRDEYVEECDTKYRERQLEVGRALDARREKINQFANNSPSSSSKYYVSVKMGPITVREPKPELFALAKPGWQEEVSSWELVFSDYNEIKGNAVDANWYALKRSVLGILSDDRNRVLTNWNPYLNKDSELPMAGFQKLLADCVHRQECVSIEMDVSTASFVQGQPYYQSFMRKISNQTTPEDKRIWIEKLLKRVTADLGNTFGFESSPFISSIGPGKFKLEIDPGPFSEALDQLRNYIESLWHSDEFSLSVDWKLRPITPNGQFIFVQEPGNGGRSFVHYGDPAKPGSNTVHLFSGVRAQSIAHEVGHVLGFPDNYFTVWNPGSCEYKVQGTDDDLMSEPSYGKVNATHWARLVKEYQK